MQPRDRLPYADCAHAEAQLDAAAGGAAMPAPLPFDAAAPCPACRRSGAASAGRTMSAGELDAMHFRFWSEDGRRFDHVGYARAVIAACDRAAHAP